ncbi:hypothetical protein K435DRAFT_866622 [Dendrothele bispora CBS 962.96]|uniref:Uncharacterized protein n=1 Tax=Dendrothele bispora (strain CBS 962.96) TaxID=1314807 RepID=A0A4S8LGI0_DENBC|nr:hypothetical protein K435DRAFT_866622 [Dendrothele bispora CBS 962.96]
MLTVLLRISAQFGRLPSSTVSKKQDANHVKTLRSGGRTTAEDMKKQSLTRIISMHSGSGTRNNQKKLVPRIHSSLFRTLLDIRFYSPLVEDITPATAGPSFATGSPNAFTFQPPANAPVFGTTGAMGSALLQ